MQDVIISYIQFLLMQVSEHAVLFVIVFLGVPAIWLLLRLTNILYEEKALMLGVVVFVVSSISAVVSLLMLDFPQEYYKPLLLLLAGFMTFLCVAPIFCLNQDFEINERRKTFTLDGNTFSVSHINQINVKRCFTRTKRSCFMEIFITEKDQRPRSIYYETNNLTKFREILNFFAKFIKIDYDCSFTKSTIENPMFGLMVKTVILGIIVFCLLIPATLALNEKRVKMSLPEYKIEIVPKDLYSNKLLSLDNDSFKDVFEKKNMQIIVFDGAHSSYFVQNLKQELFAYPNQSYDFNIVFITRKGLLLKKGFSAKVSLATSADNKYTKFITSNCNKFCILDNVSKVLYSTKLETVDPRTGNVQEAVNMLFYAQKKRIEQQKIQIANKAKAQQEEAMDENSEPKE